MFSISISSLTIFSSAVAKGPVMEPSTFLFYIFIEFFRVRFAWLGNVLFDISLALSYQFSSLSMNSTKFISVILISCNLVSIMRPLFYRKVTIYSIIPPLWFCVCLFTPTTERDALVNDPIEDFLEVSQDLLISLAMNKLFQSEFASKFLSFAKSSR